MCLRMCVCGCVCVCLVGDLACLYVDCMYESYVCVNFFVITVCVNIMIVCVFIWIGSV